MRNKLDEKDKINIAFDLGSDFRYESIRKHYNISNTIKNLNKLSHIQKRQKKGPICSAYYNEPIYSDEEETDFD